MVDHSPHLKTFTYVPEESDKGCEMLIIALILSFFVTFYHGSDNSGVVVGTEDCHVGFEVTGVVGIFAFCYLPDNSHETDIKEQRS